MRSRVTGDKLGLATALLPHIGQRHSLRFSTRCCEHSARAMSGGCAQSTPACLPRNQVTVTHYRYLSLSSTQKKRIQLVVAALSLIGNGTLGARDADQRAIC